VGGTATINNPNWTPIDDGQVPGWSDINDNQTPNWVAVAA
jgi:hypothetical protein